MKAMSGCLEEWKVIQMMMMLCLSMGIRLWLLLLKLIGQMGLALGLEVEDQEALLLNPRKKTEERLQLMPLFLYLPGHVQFIDDGEEEEYDEEEAEEEEFSERVSAPREIFFAGVYHHFLNRFLGRLLTLACQLKDQRRP